MPSRKEIPKKSNCFSKIRKLASLKQFGFTSLSCLLSKAFGELASSFLYEKQSDFLNGISLMRTYL